MKSISHQPKALALGIALVLGFAVLSTGCGQGSDNNSAGVGVPSARTTAPATAPMATPATPATTNNYGAQNGDNGYMQAGSGDSQSPVSDTWITTKVRTKLHTINGLDNSDISVETNNGIVTLSGRVNSQDQVNTAVSAIKTIKGVKDVNTSMLKVGADTNQ